MPYLDIKRNCKFLQAIIVGSLWATNDIGRLVGVVNLIATVIYHAFLDVERMQANPTDQAKYLKAIKRNCKFLFAGRRMSVF